MEEMKALAREQRDERRRQKRKEYRLQQKLKEREMSEEERVELKNKRYLQRQAYLSKLSKEQLEEQRIKAKLYRKQYWDKLSNDKKKSIGKRVMRRLRDLKGDEAALERQREIGRRAVKRYHDKLRERDGEGYREMMRGNLRRRWDGFKEYQRERVKREGEEERERRLLRYKIYGEKRKVRRMEGRWRGEEEMERRLEEVEEEVKRKWEEDKEGRMGRSEYKERIESRKPKRKREEVTMEGMAEEMVEVTQVEEEIFSGNFEEQCLSVSTYLPEEEGHHQVLALPPFLQIVGVVGAEVDSNQEVTWGGDLGANANDLVEILPSFVQEDGGLNEGIFMVVLEAPPTPPPLPPTPPPYFLFEEVEEMEEEPMPIPSPVSASNLILPEPDLSVKPFICEICGNQFSTERGVRDHINKQHNPTGDALKCSECSKFFAGPRALWRHFSKYHLTTNEITKIPCSKLPSSQITCEYCSKSVIRGYQQHLEKMHPEHYIPPNKLTDGRIQCPYCPTQLKSEIVLKKHLKYKHGDKEELRRIDKPNVFFNLERKLEAKKLIKMESKLTWCLVCKPSSQLSPASICIKAHFVTSHHEIVKDLHKMAFFSCKFCKDPECSNQENLLKHLKDNHPNQIFECSNCPVIKRTRKEMRIHQAYHRKVLKRNEGLTSAEVPEKSTCKFPLFWRGGQQTKTFIKEKLNNLMVHCPECSQVMKCKVLERHLKRKHNTQNASVKEADEDKGMDKLWCQICDKQLPSLLYQYAHSHLVHCVPLEQLIKLEYKE